MGPPSEPCMRTAARTRPDHSQKRASGIRAPRMRSIADLGSYRQSATGALRCCQDCHSHRLNL
jgi:hypothetical protein